MTKKFKMYQVDAFTQSLFGGNPAAIVPLETWLADDLMQKIALENNLSETAFFVPYEDAEFSGYHLRWFTPTIEVALCGHATLATAHVFWQFLGYKSNLLHFWTKSGWLTVRRNPATEGEDSYTLDFPANPPQPAELPNVGEALGVQPSEIYFSKWDYLAVFESQTVIENLSPNFSELAKVEARGIICTAKGTDVDFVSRCFYPASGINEDPVTGSAHTLLVPYWAERLGKTQLSAIQASERRGYLACTLNGDRVEMTGHAKTYMIGEFFIP